MTPRRLENDEVEEFWEVWVADLTLFWRSGKLGSDGHKEWRKFWTRAEAHAELAAFLEEKLDEGFFEVDPVVEAVPEPPHILLFFVACVVLLAVALIVPTRTQPARAMRPNGTAMSTPEPHFWGTTGP